MKKVTTCFWCNSRELIKVAERKDDIPVLKCKKCGLLIVGEMPEDVEGVYKDSSYYDPGESPKETGYLENYDLISPLYLMWESFLIKEIAQGKPLSLLEVGSATGSFLTTVQRFNPELKTVGIDISDYGVEVSRKLGHESYCDTDFKNLGKNKIKNSKIRNGPY